MSISHESIFPKINTVLLRNFAQFWRHSSNSVNEMAEYDDEVTTLTGTLLILISVVGFVGNFVTILIIWKNEIFKDKNYTTIFIANLALVDMISSVNSQIQGVGYIDDVWVQNMFPVTTLPTANGFLRVYHSCVSLL